MLARTGSVGSDSNASASDADPLDAAETPFATSRFFCLPRFCSTRLCLGWNDVEMVVPLPLLALLFAYVARSLFLCFVFVCGGLCWLSSFSFCSCGVDNSTTTDWPDLLIYRSEAYEEVADDDVLLSFEEKEKESTPSFYGRKYISMLQRSVVDYGDESPRSCRSSDTERQKSTGGTPVRSKSKPPLLSERQ